MLKKLLDWRLILILIGYICLGFLLSLYKASGLIWLFTILTIFYLSWSGTGAIAMVVFLIFLIVGFSIYMIKLDIWMQNFLVFEQSQWYYNFSNFIYSIQTSFFKPTPIILIWVFSFVLIWVLSTGLAFYHGFTCDFLEEKFKQHFWVFSLLSIIGLIGLKIGQIL